jgi:hypothetical protein
MDSVTVFHFSAFADRDYWTERDLIDWEDPRDRIGGPWNAIDLSPNVD